MEELRQELKETKQAMKHLQNEPTNSYAQKAKQQVDIWSLRHDQQQMKNK